jgi:RNA polymerase sigma factor (sigma-70 family)
MSDDAVLLRQYATTRSEPAFTELVERHLDLVYFAALRRCGGDAHAAKDVAQQVFTLLARDAGALANHALLTGWLYVTTRNVAANLLRSDRGRRARESEALAMNDALTPDSTVTAVDWDRIRPELDGALDELGDRDRDAVLLRFFENRPFAEIGAALRLTEDAARMRVDRALDKLRAVLARRGITSTAAALALALSQHAAQVKPVGLAGSVAAAALAGSTKVAVIGAAAAGAALLSGAKFGAGSLVAIGALGLSLAGNAWLWSRANQQASLPRSPSVMARAEAPAAATSLTFAELRRDDLSTARDQMRAAGSSDATIRGVLEGILRRRYREELSARRAQRLETGWWRERDFTRIVDGPVRMTPADDPKLFREMVQIPLERLLGPNPAEVAEINARYGFLPEVTRQKLAQLEADLALATAMDVTSRYGGTETALKTERSQLQAEQAAVLAALPPLQQQEYDLRYGWLTSGLKQRMASIDGTETEYRTVFQLVDARVKEKPAATDRDARTAAGVRIDQATADQLVSLLGYDRARDYIWSGTYDYPAYARVVREANLPIGIASRIVHLVAETGDQASQIHFDSDRSLEQKRESIQALRRKAQAELDALLPPSLQQKLAPRSLAWLAEQKDGRYKLISATLGSAPASVLALGGSAIDQPTFGRPRPVQMLPRRPGGG